MTGAAWAASPAVPFGHQRTGWAFHGAAGRPDRDPDASAGLRVAGSTAARIRKR